MFAWKLLRSGPNFVKSYSVLKYVKVIIQSLKGHNVNVVRF